MSALLASITSFLGGVGGLRGGRDGAGVGESRGGAMQPYREALASLPAKELVQRQVDRSPDCAFCGEKEQTSPSPAEPPAAAWLLRDAAEAAWLPLLAHAQSASSGLGY